MSRDNASIEYESGSVLKLKLNSLLDFLPEQVSREMIGLALANGEALRILAAMIVASATPYEARPDPPACDVYLGSESIESVRMSLMPLLGPAYEEALGEAIRSRDEAKAKLVPLMEWARIELQIEAYRISGQLTPGYQLERRQELRRAAIEIAAKDNPYFDKRPKQLDAGGHVR